MGGRHHRRRPRRRLSQGPRHHRPVRHLTTSGHHPTLQDRQGGMGLPRRHLQDQGHRPQAPPPPRPQLLQDGRRRAPHQILCPRQGPARQAPGILPRLQGRRHLLAHRARPAVHLRHHPHHHREHRRRRAHPGLCAAQTNASGAAPARPRPPRPLQRDCPAGQALLHLSPRTQPHQWQPRPASTPRRALRPPPRRPPQR